jgi:hypothetical protein
MATDCTVAIYNEQPRLLAVIVKRLRMAQKRGNKTLFEEQLQFESERC